MTNKWLELQIVVFILEFLIINNHIESNDSVNAKKNLQKNTKISASYIQMFDLFMLFGIYRI